MKAHRASLAHVVRRQIVASVQPTPGVCSRETVRCSDAREYSKELRPCCRGHIRQIVAHVMGAFGAQKLGWWADYGTLLGAVRNPLTTWADYPWLEQGGRANTPLAPGIIPHDKDADIGVLYSDWGRAWLAVMALRQKHVYRITAHSHRGSMKVRLSAQNNTNLDIFFWHQKPNGLLFRRGYARVDDYKGKHFHREMLFPLGTVEWEGMTLPAPRDPEAFLAMRYGPTWRTPLPTNHDLVAR